MTASTSSRSRTPIGVCTTVRRLLLFPAVAVLLFLGSLSFSPFDYWQRGRGRVSSSLGLVQANALGKPRREVATARSIKIQNKSGRRVDILWINRFNADGVVTYHSNSEDGKGYPYGGDTSINSYMTHEFKVQEMPSTTSSKCLGPNDTCRMGYFQVNKEEHQGKKHRTTWWL
jgi:hypothetical protein